jgi:hypothetical protein
MALQRPKSGGSKEPAYIKQQRAWGGEAARLVNGLQDNLATRGAGGQMRSETVPWKHPRGFSAWFKHKEEYSTENALYVSAGKVYTNKKTETASASAATITLPASGDLYVYVAITMGTSPTATITSNATEPDFRADFDTINWLLGKLTETSTGVWSWTVYHEGDIWLQNQNLLMFPVDLATDGGSAGDATTQCSFTYEVFDLDSNSLATGVSPVWARPALGAMVAATHGIAYLTDLGALVLYQVDEVPDLEEC